MQELEKILEEIEDHVKKFVVYGTSYDYISFRWVKQIIRKHMNDDWIPVEERLPENGETVLCTDGENIYLVEYDADLDAGFGDMDCITAWRPLPEPYRPERSEGE